MDFPVVYRALAGLDPEGVLARGYALVESGGRIVTDVGRIEPGQDVTITLSNGALDAKVIAARQGERRHGR